MITSRTWVISECIRVGESPADRRNTPAHHADAAPRREAHWRHARDQYGRRLLHRATNTIREIGGQAFVHGLTPTSGTGAGVLGLGAVLALLVPVAAGRKTRLS